MQKIKSVAKTIPVRMDLASQEHARLRVAAASAGLPMSEFARQAVKKAVEKILEKSGIK
jgi:hypothetical protein